MDYEFDEAEWGGVGVGLDYAATPELQEEVALLKILYTEIADWGDLSIFTAWGSYSQDQYDLNWQPVWERDEFFTAYLFHVEQSEGPFVWTDQDARRALKALHETTLVGC